MRQKVVAGIVLSVAPALVVVLSSALGLELEAFALLGVAVGAVVGLVPDRAPLVRLAGFGAGLVVAWVGYIARAALLPDTAGGRAVAVALVVAVCVGIAVAIDALPLWSLLLGAATFAGGYELTFAAAPTEVVASSISAVTSLLLTVAVGFLSAATFASLNEAPAPSTPDPAPRPSDSSDEASSLDDLMEKIK